MKTKAEIRETLKRGTDVETAKIWTEAHCMVNGGVIRWWWNPVTERVESYGRGPGWSDQGVSENDLEEVVSYLWSKRKYIIKGVA